MPQLIETALNLCLIRRRSLFLLVFGKTKHAPRKLTKKEETARQRALCWLEANGFTWTKCYHPSTASHLFAPWDGTICVNVATEKTDPRYQKLVAHFENPDGTSEMKTVRCQILPYPLTSEIRRFCDQIDANSLSP